ncbi:hypothetical protein Golomagni_00233 [Golovinomyces magnicellulatus]|nr:hypothetical protein Golomagni_00233 [Golovinomyces magnicellulatus]
MSYASAASKGPKQTSEEACPDKRAPAPIELERHEPVPAVSLIDTDAASVLTVPSDFSSQSVQTETQASRIEHELEVEEKARARAVKESLEDTTKKDRQSNEKNARSKKSGDRPDGDAGDLVLLFNTVAVIAIGSGLGFGAYQKYTAGELSWKAVGLWAGVVGAFAMANFNLTQFFTSNYDTRE